MLDLRRLRALQAVAAHGSVTKAAESIHLTPSAVSQLVAKLERSIGQPLLEPAGRGVRLTPLAEQLTIRAHEILAMVEKAEAEIERGSDAIFGTLTIASFATAARALVAPAVRNLRASYPDLTVRVQELEPSEAVRLLEQGQIDLAVIDTWTELPIAISEGLRSVALVEDVADLLVSHDHPLGSRASATLADVPLDQVWITWPEGSNCHSWLSHHLRAGGRGVPNPHTAMEHATQLAFVAAGLGAAIVPRLGRGPLPHGVCAVDLTPPPSRIVHALWREHATRRPSTRAALDALEEVAARDRAG